MNFPLVSFGKKYITKNERVSRSAWYTHQIIPPSQYKLYRPHYCCIYLLTSYVLHYKCRFVGIKSIQPTAANGSKETMNRNPYQRNDHKRLLLIKKGQINLCQSVPVCVNTQQCQHSAPRWARGRDNKDSACALTSALQSFKLNIKPSTHVSQILSSS